MIRYLPLLLWLLLLPTLPLAREYYVAPGGSGAADPSGCTFASPCTLNTAKDDAVAGDTVWLKDGTYTQGFKTVRGGSSNTSRISFKALNRHAAIIRAPSSPTQSHFHIDHSWITVSGLNIWNTSTGGSHSSDASKISDGTDKHAAIQGVLFEDNYVHDAGHALIWSGNTNTGVGIEIRHNTFDVGGLTAKDGWEGEGFYLGSCCQKQSPAKANIHHNIVSKFKANAVDFKGESRDINFHDNFVIDHLQHTCATCNSDCIHDSTLVCMNNDTSDGLFVTGADGLSINDGNNFTQDNVVWRPRSRYIFSFGDNIKVRSIGNVVIDWIDTPGGATNGTLNSTSMDDESTSHSNIHCPSESMAHGEQTNGANPANQINQPIAECNDRIDEIVGKPEMSSCEIGVVNDNTVTVNILTTKNGPVSGIPVNLEVTYNGTNQTGEITTLFSGNQARIAVVTPPVDDAVVVRVVAAAGAIRNSAFIGAKDCDNGSNWEGSEASNYVRTGGFCGENDVQTLICANTTEGAGPPPVTETLDQAVWRFYGIHNAPGVAPLASENTNVTSSEGGEFRFRVGVRGGGNNSPSRSYALAARVCKPTCGGWFNVSDDTNVGVVFVDDDVQADGTATTNQLSLGGKTFSAGIFIDQPRSTPAKAILTTQQVEWEFALQIPEVNTSVDVGDTIELRIEHDDGTVLSAYTLPSITVGPPGVGGGIGSRAGPIKGTMK